MKGLRVGGSVFIAVLVLCYNVYIIECSTGHTGHSSAGSEVNLGSRPYCLPLLTANQTSDICMSIPPNSMYCASSNNTPWQLSNFSQADWQEKTGASWRKSHCPDHPDTASLFKSTVEYCNYGLCKTDEDCRGSQEFSAPICFEYCMYCYSEHTKEEAKEFCKEEKHDGHVASESDDRCWQGDWSFSPWSYVEDFWHAVVIVLFVLVALIVFAVAVYIAKQKRDLIGYSPGSLSASPRTPKHGGDLEDLEVDAKSDEEDEPEEEDNKHDQKNRSYGLYGDMMKEEETSEAEGNSKGRSKLGSAIGRKKDKNVTVMFSENKRRGDDDDDL